MKRWAVTVPGYGVISAAPADGTADSARRLVAQAMHELRHPVDQRLLVAEPERERPQRYSTRRGR